MKSYTSAAPTAAGNVVTYSIVTTNTGTVTLTNVSTSDPLLPTLTCSPTQPVASLIPGASYTCTGSYTVTAADVTAGHVINTATATGTYNSNVTVTGTSNTINLPLSAPAPAYVPAPGLTVTKQLTATVNGKVGDVISYKITVTNSGDTYLTGVTLTDANAVMGTCSVTLPTALAQGESFTCVATHVVTDADVKAGKVRGRDATLLRDGEPVARVVDLEAALEVLRGKIEFESGEEGREREGLGHVEEDRVTGLDG